MRYRLADGEWTTLSGSTATQQTVAAAGLPSGNVEWQVRVQDTASRWSEWSAVITLTTVESAPQSPTLLSPVDAYVPLSSQIVFAWRHNNAIGTPQGKADLQYKLGAGEYVDVSIADATASYTLTAFTLDPGTVTWRVRTYSRNDLAGPWSAEALFSITGAPVAPIITVVTARGGRPIVYWSSEGQIVYQLKILDAAGAIVYETEARAAGDTDSFTPAFFLPAGAYSIQIRAKNQYDYWSDWTTVAHTVSMTVRTAPEIIAASNAYAVRISVAGVSWSTIDRALLYRDGVPIAKLTENIYDDYAAPSSDAAYFVRLVYAGEEYVDTAIVTAAARMPGTAIAQASALDTPILVRVNLDGPPQISRQLQPESQQDQTIGRMLPVTTFGEHETRSYSIGFIASLADLLRLRSLGRTPVLLRDTLGRRDFCRVAQLLENPVPYVAGKAAVSLVLDATDYDENVGVE
jgi:hypothetical protein